MSSSPEPEDQSPGGQMLIYQDGGLKLQVRLDGQTVWLTQAGMADLYQTTPQNVTLHVQNIFDEVEHAQAATCKECLQVRTEGNRQVQRLLRHYSLDMILAVGYRVRSPRGTLFRQWATARLSGLLVVRHPPDLDAAGPGHGSIPSDLAAGILLHGQPEVLHVRVGPPCGSLCTRYLLQTAGVNFDVVEYNTRFSVANTQRGVCNERGYPNSAGD